MKTRIFVLALASLLVGTFHSRAAVVTTLADSGPGSLREAVAIANTNAEITAITFDAALSAKTITLSGGQLMLNNYVVIDASALPGGIVISGNASSRLFQMTPTAVVTLNSLILASGAVSSDMGGAILNSGQLTAIGCVFTNNTALGGAGVTPGEVSNGGGGGGGAGMGGAIFSDGLALTLTNCVFSHNRVLGGTGGNGRGTTGNDDPGGNGGGPNAGLGGPIGYPGGTGGYGGGAGGGAGSGYTGYAGGTGGFGGGGGGGGARGWGGDGGLGGIGGLYGGNGGIGAASDAGAGGGGAGLGGAVYAKSGVVTVLSCTFTGNLATNGLGGYGSFGIGNGQNGQGVGGALFYDSADLTLQDNVFSGNVASSVAPDINISVTTVADNGPGSLREAVALANTQAGCAITFVSTLSGQTITLTSGQLLLLSNTRIDASTLANRIAISGSGSSRVFQLAPTAAVTLNSLILASGTVSSDMGGAVLNLGQLTAIGCLFTNNTAMGGAGVTPGEISNGGGGGGGAGMGGAIFCDGSGLSLTNCVFIDNRVLGGTGGNGRGTTANDDPGGAGGGPNGGIGGPIGYPGGTGGYGGGAGGGAGSGDIGYAGGTGGYGGGGGGGGAAGWGGDGGPGGPGGLYGGNGGMGAASDAGAGGGGAGLGGAVYAKAGAVAVINCTFISNLATNGLGGYGSFGMGNGQPGQGIGGALFFVTPDLILQGNSFSGNVASSFGANMLSPFLVYVPADSGLGSLRQAVANANTAPHPAAIAFESALSGQTITLTSGQLLLNNNVSIDASALASGIAISGNNNSRVFQIAPTATVTLNSLTLGSGTASGDMGGAILNSGQLTAVGCLFMNNTASGGAGITPGEVSNGGGGGGGAGMGGAIFSDGVALALTNCAFSNNRVLGGTGGDGRGTTGNDDPGGNGGGPNAGLGGPIGYPGGAGGYGGGAGGGAGSGYAGYAGGTGGYGGGGGGGGARGWGGDGGLGGLGGPYGGSGGIGAASDAGAGGGGAGLGGAVYAKAGAVAVVNCTFTSNLATNGLGGYGSFGIGNGQNGQGVGGAIFGDNADLLLRGNTFSGNMASSFAPDVLPYLVTTVADSGLGSLRQAVANANAAGHWPAIIFDAGLSGQTITLTSGQLLLNNNVSIGASALASGIAISGNNSSRVFQIAPTATVTLNSLTLGSGTASSDMGGAILNSGQLTAVGCLFMNNTAWGGAGITPGEVSNGGGGGGGAGMGGAIFSDGVALALTNCAFSNNRVLGGIGGDGRGTTGNDDPGGNGGGPNAGLGGPIGYPGGAGGYGGGAGGGAGSGYTGYAGGTGGYGGGGGGGGARGWGGDGGLGGLGGLYGGNGGMGAASDAGAGGGGAGLGGAVFSRIGTVALVNCTFTGNLATNGLGGYGSFGIGNGQPGQGGGGALFCASGPLYVRGNVFSGNIASSFAPDLYPVATQPLLVGPSLLPGGALQFSFANTAGLSFSVYATPDASLPFSQWTLLGTATESAPGQYQFTDSANSPQRFYRVVWP